MTRYYFNEDGTRRIVRAVRRVEQDPRTFDGSLPPMVSGHVRGNPLPCINDAGESIPPYSICPLDTGATDGFRRPKLKKSSTTFRRLFGLTGNWTAENGKKCGVMVAVAGTGLVKYAGATPVTGEAWGAEPGKFTISKNFPACCEIIDVWDASRSLALVALFPISRILCKCTDNNAAGSLATDTSDYKIQKGTAGSEADAGFTTQPAIYAREATSNNQFFFADWVNGLWYADLETGRILMYKAKLNGALADTDANATIDNVTAFGGGTAPSPTSAANTLDLAGADNDDCVIVKDGTGYYLLNVQHYACD